MQKVIKRSDAIYVELDSIESKVKQYYTLRNHLHTRKMEQIFVKKYGDYEKDFEFEIEYKISQSIKELIVEFITKHYKNKDIVGEIKEQINSDAANLMDLFSIMAYFNGDDDFQELLFKQFSGVANAFVTSYDFYNDPNEQIWLRLDLSLSKEELVTQIQELKDAHDAHDANVFTFNGIKRTPRESDPEWIGKGLNPLTFSKSINRQFGDLLFIYDCINSGYKKRYIINESFNYRNESKGKQTALTNKTINDYLKKADEVMETIII
ncbi:hypothetical protein JZU61_00355 [bacterium]|nr:hypothetical protein [bacterium]